MAVVLTFRLGAAARGVCARATRYGGSANVPLGRGGKSRGCPPSPLQSEQGQEDIPGAGTNRSGWAANVPLGRGGERCVRPQLAAWHSANVPLIVRIIDSSRGAWGGATDLGVAVAVAPGGQRVAGAPGGRRRGHARAHAGHHRGRVGGQRGEHGGAPLHGAASASAARGGQARPPRAAASGRRGAYPQGAHPARRRRDGGAAGEARRLPALLRGA
eukprot:967251-Prorocentrum_minimum.AAC.1